MHESRRRVTPLLAGASVLLMLAACTSPTAPGGREDGASESGQASESESAARPSPLIDLACTELLDSELIDDALGAPAELVAADRAGIGSYFWLSQVGAEQAGMLDCEWVSGSGVDERYLEVAVLGAARDAWTAVAADGPLMLVQDTADRFGDASWDGCLSACFADVLVDDAWISIAVSAPDALDPLTEALVATIAAASTLEPSWSTDAAAPPDCETALPIATVQGQGSPELQPWVKDDPVRTIHHGGFLAAGGLYCSWRNSFDSATAVTADLAVLPGGAWAWSEHLALPAPGSYSRDVVEGLGDEAWIACSENGDCAVSVLVGETWIDVEYRDEAGAGQRETAITLASAVLAAITE